MNNNQTFSYKDICKVTFPVVLMLLAQTIVQIAGTIFMSQVGLAQQKAVTVAGIFYIAFFTICFGFSIGAQIMVSRRNGEKNYTSIGEIIIQGTIFLLIFALLLFFLCDYVLSHILGNFMDEQDVYVYMKEYLQYRMFGFFFASINVMFRAFYVGIAKTPVLTYNAIVMTVVNIFLDYALIFGNFGFPELGVKGAGIAAIASEIAAILFFFIFTYAAVDFDKYHFHKMKFRPKIIKRILNISSFTMLQNVLSMGTWFMFFMCVQHKTAMQLAAGMENPEDSLGITTVIRTIYMIFFVSIGAFSTTSNTLVGNTIGRGNIADVIPLIKRISIASLIVSAVIIFLMLLSPDKLIAMFLQKTPELVPQTLPSFYVILAALPVLSVGAVVFNAISGTGNTRAALILEFIALAFYSIYMYWIIIIEQAPTSICWTVEYVYWGGLLIAGLLYFKYAKWQNKIV